MPPASLFTVGTFLLMTGASAQAPGALTAQKMPSALRHAGIYHVSTGTWTRTGGQAANFGPDVVYSNTAGSSYFSSAGGLGGFAPNSENFDEGGIPGTTNGTGFALSPNRDQYRVNCVQIGYCDMNAAGTGGWRLKFLSEYTPCTLNTAPGNQVLLMGLPANGGCWLVDVDLTGGNEFCLDADGVGDWDDDTDLDSFGWSCTYSGTASAPGAPAGFLLTGNPAVTDPGFIVGGLPLDGSNTYYGTTACPGVGTGFITQDIWWLEDPATTSSGCYFFGGYGNNNGSCTGPSRPYASWHLQLAAALGPCEPPDPGTVYCNSNPNSTGSTTGLGFTGSQAAADDDVTIHGLDMPNQSFGYFIVSETQGFVANPNGSQGNLCVLGAIGRFVGPGQIQNSGTTGAVSISTGPGGVFSLTAMPTPQGSRMSVAGTTDNFQLWHRDVVGGVATSNFSNGSSITWL